MFNFENVKKVFDEFWDAASADLNTGMYGLADIWEGPSRSGGPSTNSGSSMIFAIETYKDSVYILQGGGAKSWLKVVSPNGHRIYDIGIWMVHQLWNSQPKYFSLAVINENEVLAGNMYLNLEHQFCAPFGIDIDSMYRSPFFSVSNVAANSSAWISAIRDVNGFNIYVGSKASPEDCLPCYLRQGYIDISDFSCSEELYSTNRFDMPGYEGDTLSYTDNGYGRRLPRPSMNPEKCMKAINNHSEVFNHVTVSPADVGRTSYAISKYCNSVMYKSMLKSAEYSSSSDKMKEDYINRLISGDPAANLKLLDESTRLTGLIGELLYGISSSLGDNYFTKSLFRDTSWWAPIWFTANKSKIRELNEGVSAYTLLHGVRMIEDFIPLLQGASVEPLSVEESLDSMGWVIIGKKGSATVKFGKNNMTYFRFPNSTCISMRKIHTLPLSDDIDGFCGLETRGNGLILWAWRYSDESVLKCYLYSNEGVFSEIASETIPSSFSPASGSTMGVSYSEGTWIIRDYFLSGRNKIDYVDIEVPTSREMDQLLGAETVLQYANLNEVTGGWRVASARHHGDGTLDEEQGRFGLDDGSVMLDHTYYENAEAWSKMDSYFGYQIVSFDKI